MTTTTATADQGAQPDLRVLLFKLADEWYALPDDPIQELLRWRQPTPVPGATPSLLGVFNLRGEIVPLIDPRPLLNLPQAQPSRSSRLMIIHVGDIHLALLVDKIHDLVKVPASQREAAPSGTTPLTAAMLITPIGRASLLDAEALVAALRGR